MVDGAFLGPEHREVLFIDLEVWHNVAQAAAEQVLVSLQLSIIVAVDSLGFPNRHTLRTARDHLM